jgi:hypothetical protein
MLPLLVALALHAPAPAPVPAPQPPAAEAVPPAEAPAGSAAPPSTGPLRGDWSTPSGKRVTLAGPMPLDQALERISDAAGWNTVLDTGHAGSRKLKLKLRDVPVEEALRDALTGSGLVATRTGNTVVVSEEARLVPPSAQVLSGFDPPTGRRFTGEFDEEDVDDALKQIASSAGLSIVLPRGPITGSISATFRNVPVEDALRAALVRGGLTARREGEVIVVAREGRADAGSHHGLTGEAERTAQKAIEQAQRAMHDAMSQVHKPEAESDGGHDREVTGHDLTIGPTDEVRDVNVVTGNLRVQAGADVRDANVVMGNTKLDAGATARDIATVMGNTTLDSGATARQVVTVFGNIDIGPGAEVEQDVISVAGRVHVDPSAHVGGSTHSVGFPRIPKWPSLSIHFPPRIPSPLAMTFGTLVRFAVLFVLGLAVLAVTPRRMEAVSGAMVARPWWSLFAGVLGTLAMPVLGLLLLATGVGALLLPVQILAILGGGVLGITALTHYMGRVLPIPPSRRTVVLELAAGTLVFSILAEIPILGVLLWITTWFLAFGAVLRTRFGQPPAALPTTPAPPAAA